MTAEIDLRHFLDTCPTRGCRKATVAYGVRSITGSHLVLEYGCPDDGLEWTCHWEHPSAWTFMDCPCKTCQAVK